MDPSFNHTIILASKSPRRQYLLRELGLHFTVRTKETDESFSPDLKAEQIPLFLCDKKAVAFANELKAGELLITADTIVWINGQVLNKPDDETDALRMLQLLAGKMHEVFTGVCLMSREKKRSFFVRTKVYFKPADDATLLHYIRTCKPFDKAGAYGAQECLPKGMKPCSPEEVVFLQQQNALHLNTAHDDPKKDRERSYVEVEKIEGSYFNVMGLPLVELYNALATF